MTLDELEAFVQIARLGGFGEASRVLGRTQPAITRRILQLEEALGARLLDRRGRKVVLTAAGETLLPHAEAAIAAAREGERAVRDLEAGTSGAQTLRVAIVGTLADSHLVDALEAFGSEFPHVTVELRTATSREVSALVRSGEAQLGLRYFPDPDPRLESLVIGSEQLFVVVPRAHPIEATRLGDPSVLAGESWVCFPAARNELESLGALSQRLLASWHLASSPVTVVDSLTAQKRLVQARLGLGIMPLSAIREELVLGSLRAIEIIGDDSTELPVVAVRRSGGYGSALASSFVEVMRRFMRLP